MKNPGSKKIAERYAHALFDVAQQSGILAVVEKDLQVLADLIKENADFRAFLHNPLLTRAAQGAIAGNILQSIGTNAVTSQFIALLAHNKRLDMLPEIIIIFLEKAAKGRGELAAELITARSVSDKETGAIAQSLGKAYNKKINLRVREDPSLLGGVIINIGSMQLDSSLAGKLNRLEQALKTA